MATPTQIASGGHLSAPTALAVNGSTLYVANSNGTVAVYSATTSATTYVTTVTLAASTVPTALAVDSGSSGSVYVADGANGRVAYFPVATCNATATTGCTSHAPIRLGRELIRRAHPLGRIRRPLRGQRRERGR